MDDLLPGFQRFQWWAFRLTAGGYLVVAAIVLLLGGSRAIAWALLWFVLACVYFVVAPMRLAAAHHNLLLCGLWFVIGAGFWL